MTPKRFYFRASEMFEARNIEEGENQIEDAITDYIDGSEITYLTVEETGN